MILPERLSVYLDSLETGNGVFLDKLEEEAIGAQVPVIRRGMQSLLKVLLSIRCPRSILEVGTGVGFSALMMAECTACTCQITTIENDKKRIQTAEKNFARAGRKERITLLAGDAREILPSLSGPYDFIFMDAAKGQYLPFLPEILRLLPKGGVLVTDNVLQDGMILESHYAVKQRDRTIHKRMREYLYVLKHTEGLLTSVAAVGDGAAVTVKQKEIIEMGETAS